MRRLRRKSLSQPSGLNAPEKFTIPQMRSSMKPFISVTWINATSGKRSVHGLLKKLERNRNPVHGGAYFYHFDKENTTTG